VRGQQQVHDLQMRKPRARRPPTGTIAAAFAVVIAFAMAIAIPAAALAVTRGPLDAEEVAKIRAVHPKAVDLLERGEALALGGSLEPAHAIFAQAEAEDSDGSILWRRDCEVLTLLGRRDEALRACNMATQGSRSNLNLRATVRALVAGPDAPKPVNLFLSLALVEDRLRKSGRVDPVLADIACDIAESVGDTKMLQECADNLGTIAPDDPNTRRALAMLAGQCPPWRFWLGWAALAVAGAGTLAHAAAGRLRRRRSRGVAAIALGVLALASVLTPAGMARAQGPAPQRMVAPKGALSEWPVDDDDPAGSIPTESQRNGDPLQFGYWIQDLIMKAEHAAKRGNHEQAAKYWVALGIAVPDRAISFSRLCDEYEAESAYDKAIEACGQALLRDGLTVNDYVHFVHVVLAKPGPVEAKEVAALGQVLDHMKAEEASRAVANDLECEIGVRTANAAMLRECTAALNAAAPDDPKTISYRWALAVQENKFKEAAELIALAKAKGMQAESVASMERTTADSSRQYWKRVFLWVSCLGLLLAAMGVAAKLLGARRDGPSGRDVHAATSRTPA
jgi:tetratricopeptide (TPR) repeat protein